MGNLSSDGRDLPTAARRPSDERGFLAPAWYRLGQYDLARAAFERADRLNRSTRPAYLRVRDLAYLAMCHHQIGDTEQARAILDQTEDAGDLEVDPETTGALAEMRETVTGPE